MYGKQIGTILIIICTIACASAANAKTTRHHDAAYSQQVYKPFRIAKKPRKTIRAENSKVRKLDKSLSKEQAIFVKMIETEEVDYLGKGWSTERQKTLMKNSMVKRIQKKFLELLLYKGFLGYTYEELSEQSNLDDAILVEIRIDNLLYGAVQHVATISVNISGLNDPTLVYGTYVDGGRVNFLTQRLVQRFTLSAD